MLIILSVPVTWPWLWHHLLCQSLEQPDNIKVVAGSGTVDNEAVKLTMPGLPLGVVRFRP